MGTFGPTTACMLLIGDRVVLRANAPPEAEYILFEVGDIELRSSEPGRVREHGYQTTVERARARLAQAGVTPVLARECAVAMQPALAVAYARGPAAKHVARHLTALELFQAEHYDANAHVYRGLFIDLPALVADIDLPSATVAFQAMYLAMLLEGEDDETTVFLSTDAWTKQRRAGERTHRRANTTAVKDMRSSLAVLAELDPRPVVTEHLPRADVIAFVRSRAESAGDDQARELYVSLERAIAVREIPEKGRLAEQELWSIETRLDAGDYDGILEAVERAERSRGRTPGTTYLRARASLALRLEPPQLIAERVSALALSMTSFGELCLLAAEAWLEAGDPRRAMPFARDLVDAPGVDEGLLLRAKRVLARAVGAAPDSNPKARTAPPTATMPATRSEPPSGRMPMAPVSVVDPSSPFRIWSAEKSRVPTQVDQRRPPTNPRIGAVRVPVRGDAGAELEIEADPSPSASKPASLPPSPAGRPRGASPNETPPPLVDHVLAEPPSAADTSALEPAPVSSLAPALRPASPSAPPLPNTPPPELEAASDPLAASFTLDFPGPDFLANSAPGHSPSDAPEDERTASQRAPLVRRQSIGFVRMESRVPPRFDPRAEPEGDPPVALKVSRLTPLKVPGPLVPTPMPGPRPSPAPSSVTAREPNAIRETPRGNEFEETRRRLAGDQPAVTPIPDGTRDPRDNQHIRPTPLRPPAPSSAAAVEFGSVGAPASPVGSLHGASLPPYRLETPAPLLTRAPLLPRSGGAADELAEHLALPPGVGDDARSEGLPQSVLEARVTFTLLARELGIDYRLKRGVELRADVGGIEAMQAVLLESFPDHAIHTAEQAYELRRHGAFLSEILARRLDAEWVDISPGELGYWSMIMPPDTRVWPFGRVARLIAMGHKERDLVSYFFELHARARIR